MFGRWDSALKKSLLRKLNPFIDEDGLLRIGGRLTNADLPRDERHPVILPKTHHIATLIVRHYHEDVFHQGRHFTEGAVRSAGVWIVGGKRLVSSVIYNCVTCKKLRGRLMEQKMAPLPADRLASEPLLPMSVWTSSDHGALSLGALVEVVLKVSDGQCYSHA